ncbi:Frt2p [Maudiozyma barnettii]|uniref:Similar to Saccharomyces cerevisiae YAL028W FRT2 Tail-anchored ER membrane protein, interacts with homolog Frt1p n=1 Tax=Maudiozyma barnettii TaxID=61262 RepID=A0A8H2VGU2_9SACH|nr:Frt2p [Kazachstania barnettii]CAB4255320.1 similar to Saccharomyces cerevisiae YAL028W FRT2 Tail-anchored ER membrane protein, interacts with homolog Frt1p [Kazachstania barnettii]
MSRLIQRMEDHQNDNISSLKKAFIRPSESQSNSNLGGSKVPRIEINNKLSDVASISRFEPISAINMQERERRHAHHKRARVGNPDYTSATTGTFSDCMFDVRDSSRTIGGIPNSNGSGNPNGSSSLASPSPGDNGSASGDVLNRDIDISDISLGNYVFRHRPMVISGENDSTLPNGRLGSSLNKKVHRHNKSRAEDNPRSASFNSDKKRLVNEFLESMAPPTASTTKMSNILFPSNNSTSTTNAVGKGNMNEITPVYSNDSDKSLQSLLYHDLEQSPTRNDNNSPSSQRLSPVSKLSSETTGTDSSDDSDTSSFSSVSSFQSLTNRNVSIQNTSSLLLDHEDADYYQHHIAYALNNIETIMKVNLRESAMKRENDFQKGLKDFDAVHTELEALKNRVLRLKDIVSNKYLIELERDFEESDPASYQSKLKQSVGASVADLESIEKRMNHCKTKLEQQKEVIKRMDSLLFVENSLISSRESMGMFTKYKYVIYDFITVIVIIILAIFFNKQLNKPIPLPHSFTNTNQTI